MTELSDRHGKFREYWHGGKRDAFPSIPDIFDAGYEAGRSSLESENARLREALNDRVMQISNLEQQITNINSELFDEKRQHAKIVLELERSRDTWKDAAEKTGQKLAKAERVMRDYEESRETNV